MRKDNTKELHLKLRKAVMDWLLKGEKPPTAIVFDVPMRPNGERADILAASFSRGFHTSVGRKSEATLPQRVAIGAFVCCANRRECLLEYADAREMSDEIARLREERARLEEQIRKEEPELKDQNVLFEELATWDYEKSTNPTYQKIQKSIAWYEEILYNGTKLQHFQEMEFANQLYIVVPEGLIQPEGFREEWGLIWVAEDGTVTVKHEPMQMKTQAAGKLLALKRMLETSTSNNVASLNKKYRHSLKKQ